MPAAQGPGRPARSRSTQSLKQYKKGGAAFHKQVQAALKSNKGAGKQALQNPLGGLTGAAAAPRFP